jgi:6-phosphogluconolactonase/glucosamine-6-phosphate isomerase/deaminase
MKIVKIHSTNEAAEKIADSILVQLKQNKKVLWLSGGGSGIRVVVETSIILKERSNLANLTFTLTDERYGDIGHKDSNWQQLLDAGFSLPQATLRSVLTGKDINTTTQYFAQILERELDKADFNIGLFGMGADGHTAGILPHSPAIEAEQAATCYKTPDFERITMTFKAIKEINKAVLFAIGQSKHQMLDNLEKDLALSEQPAQILKEIENFSVYNDYKGESL